MTPEAKARVEVGQLLVQAGWHVCGMTDFDIHAAQGVAMLRKTAGLVDLLREALSPLADKIECAFVYGFMARGEEPGLRQVAVDPLK